MKLKLIIFFFFPLSVFAQDIDVAGTVISSEDQMPLPGVNVFVEGTDYGVVTDFDGNYILPDVSPQAIIVFSFLGFETLRVPVNNRNEIDVALDVNAEQLEDVVVTGYTSQRKADITGAVSVVDMDEVNKQPEPNPVRALQGRLPGVQITSDGSPSGANTQVVIRGVGTLNNTDPLYVIDGVPTKAGMHELNPNNIESMQVLKDAAAASIYGSRASNGVIIITTKKGKEGVARINFNSYLSASNYANRQEVLNAEQYGRVLWKAQVNDGIDPNSNNLRYQFEWDYNEDGQPVLHDIIVPEFLDAEQTLRSADTDWFDEISQTGFAQSYDLSVSNGTERGNYLLSLGYYDNQGIVRTTEFERISARVNTSYKFFDDRLEIGENISLNKTSEVQNPGVLDLALKALPIIPVRTVDGEGWGGPVGGMNDRQNPVRLLEYNKDNGYEYHRVFGNFYARLEPLENLNLRTNFGVDYNNFYQRILQRSYQSGYLRNDQSAVNINDWRTLKWTWTNTATYNVLLEDHDISLLAGTEIFREKFRNISLRREDFIIETPNYMFPDAGSGEAYNGGSASSYSLLSYFAKLDYTFDSKYLFSATIRRDGSSRFGENNQFGTFPAFSAGWRISEEDLFQDDYLFMTDLKLRVGWGQTGNQEIANNAIYALYIADYAGGDPTWGTSYGTAYDLTGAGSGLLPSGFRGIQLANDDLKWETTTQTNIGLDFGFFNNRLSGSLEYYFKETEDILVLPPYLGTIGEGGNRWVNGASMENEGWEFLATYRGETEGGLSYEVSGNISTNRNEITFLPQEVQNNYGGDGDEDNILGRPINSMYGYIADGLFDNAEEVLNSAEQAGKDLGRIRYRDLNGDGVITDDDRTWIGIPHPDFSYGFNIVLGYKNWDFTSFWQGVGNVDVINNRKFQTDFWSVDDVGSNKGARLLDAWSPENPNTDVPALTTIDGNAESRFSTYYVENGRYLKLRNLQVGYTLSEGLLERMKFNNLRFYVSGQNLLTITSSEFTGVDPENAGWGYPQPLTVTLGLNLSL